MPTLNWIGKEAVVNHDKEVPFRLLRKVKSSSVGENSQNLIIHGDNLEALKALMPYYIGKIKCIYIDPPYNTGNESWVYNDKVNSPKIKKWLGKVVGGESADLCRHDKWLCMIYPRIKLLKDLLTNDGAIFVSIDDGEGHYLKALMDEIFGRENFIASIIWEKKYTVANDAKWFSDNHDFILAFAKNKDIWRPNALPRSENMDKAYKNPDNHPKGVWKATPLHAKSGSVKNMNFSYTFKNGVTWTPPLGTFPRFSPESLNRLDENNEIWFGKDGKSIPSKKTFLKDLTDKGAVVRTIWKFDEVGHNHEAREEVKLLIEENTFDTPKPTRLLERIIHISTNADDIILDSFAGSGTLAHAVMNLNKEQKTNRKFVLVEMEDKVAKDITAERVKRAIKKYDYKDGFEYCELDKPLFDERGQIEETCEFNQFATYIYFTETQTNIDKNKIEKNFIGEHSDTEFYLIYKEKDKNILTKSFLSKLRETEHKKIVYADKNYLDEDILLKYNVVFKQIPYEVKVY